MSRLPFVSACPTLSCAFAALCLLFAGCDGSSGAPPSRTDESVMEARQQALERKQLTQVPADQPEPVVGEVPARVMADVRDHLAGRTGGDPDAFEVLRAEAHEWPSGALGCPQPDLVYTQRPVSGYWIVLVHDGRNYDYRVSDSGMMVLCEAMTLENPPRQ